VSTKTSNPTEGIYFKRPTLYPEPEFVNVSGAQESVSRNRIRQARNRFLGSLKGLKIGLSYTYSPGIDSASLCSMAGRCDNPICCSSFPGYIGWWNLFFGIDFWAP
jgi:hypothetical protein